MKPEFQDNSRKYSFRSLILYLRQKYSEKAAMKFIIGLAITSIVIGLAVFIIFLVILSNEYSIAGDGIILDKTGQVGDFIGGVVGAIWALTGVLLFYVTLRLQSRELAENRKQFQISRLTDIIYKQLDLFNSHILNFKLKDIERVDGQLIEQKGRAAIALLRHRVESIKDIRNGKGNVNIEDEATKDFIIKTYAFIQLNENELQNIYNELDNQINVIRAVLIKEEIPPVDLNELKSIFFRNIGLDFINASELLKILLEGYIEFKKRSGEDIDDIFSPITSIRSKISDIESFRKMIYNQSTINDYIKSREMYNHAYF